MSGGRGLRVYVAAFFLYLLLPVAVLMVYAFNDSQLFTWPPEGFTFDWFREAADSRIIKESLTNSFVIAGGVTGLSTLLAVPTAYGLARWRFIGKGVVESLLLLAILTYGVVTAVALLLWFRTLRISGGIWPTIIGHTTFIFPFGVVVIRDRLLNFDLSLEEASFDLGASRKRTFLQITLPLIAPSIIAAMLFMFTLSIGEFILAVFLLGSEPTFPVYLASQMRFGLSPVLNAAATVIILVPFVLTILAFVWLRREIEEAIT
jgi:spermidine/putrescine transport system permease protein